MKELYRYIIEQLDNFTFFKGEVAYIDSKLENDFQYIYDDYIVDVDRRSTFLYGYDLKDDAPEEAFAMLLEIYSNHLIGLANVFKAKTKEEVDKYIFMAKMIGELS